MEFKNLDLALLENQFNKLDTSERGALFRNLPRYIDRFESTIERCSTTPIATQYRQIDNLIVDFLNTLKENNPIVTREDVEEKLRDLLENDKKGFLKVLKSYNGFQLISDRLTNDCGHNVYYRWLETEECMDGIVIGTTNSNRTIDCDSMFFRNIDTLSYDSYIEDHLDSGEIIRACSELEEHIWDEITGSIEDTRLWDWLCDEYADMNDWVMDDEA